ncbi:MAG: hypothetical protein R3E79_34840 [Caldilineaceae bacterium]
MDAPVAASAGACGEPATFIHTIQGAGATSPRWGDAVTVEGWWLVIFKV